MRCSCARSASSRRTPSRPDERDTGRSGTAARRREHRSARVIGVQVREHDVARRPRQVDGRPTRPGPASSAHGRYGAERADPGVDEHVARRRPQQERVDVPRPMVVIRRTPTGARRARPAQSTLLPGSFVGERERRPALTDREDLDVADAERVVRHGDEPTAGPASRDPGRRARRRRAACRARDRGRSTSPRRSRRRGSASSRARSRRSPSCSSAWTASRAGRPARRRAAAGTGRRPASATASTGASPATRSISSRTAVDRSGMSPPATNASSERRHLRQARASPASGPSPSRRRGRTVHRRPERQRRLRCSGARTTTTSPHTSASRSTACCRSGMPR